VTVFQVIQQCRCKHPASATVFLLKLSSAYFTACDSGINWDCKIFQLFKHCISSQVCFHFHFRC